MKGGKTHNDRIKSASVRDKVLDAILKVYSGQEDKLSQRQWELTLRMATTVLPRLNEHSGPEGSPIPISNVFLPNNDSNQEGSEVKE